MHAYIIITATPRTHLPPSALIRPVYLEASGAASAAFYRRHGFLDIKQVRASPGAPELYIMARPRASQLQQQAQQQGQQ